MASGRLVALGAVLVAGTAGLTSQEVFRSGVDMVHLPVVVLDRAGTPIRGLIADDFEVREAGLVQAIASFAEGPPGPDVPLHLGLMLDKSESMVLDSREAGTAVVRFIEAVDEARDVTFVEFDSRIRLARFEPPSYPQLFTRIRAMGQGHFTALYDAIAHYAASIHERSGQHLLVLYTDGGDTSSRLTATHIRDTLRLGNVMLYVIGFLEHATPSDRARVRGVLTDLARETGGEAFYPSNAKDTAKFYAQIQGEIAGRYTIGYSRAAPTGRQGFQRVEVTLRRGIPGATVRARRGYSTR